MLDPLLILELAALGLATGFLAGLLGIGGGMLIGPFMTLILSSLGVAADLAVPGKEERGDGDHPISPSAFNIVSIFASVPMELHFTVQRPASPGA